MLVVDISVNRIEKVDTILIHRIETNNNGVHTYRIERPVGFEDKLIKHRYSDGALELLHKALHVILKGEEDYGK